MTADEAPDQRLCSGGRKGRANAPADRSRAEAFGAACRQTADRPRARSARGRWNQARRRQRASSGRSDRKARRRVARAPKIIISDERNALLDTGGGVLRALPKLGRAPFLIHNSDSVWIEGMGSNLDRLIDAWDDAAMDSLMLVAPVASSIGYDGSGDFQMDATGRLTRQVRRARRAVRLRRRFDRASAFVRRRAAGPFLAEPALGSRHREGPALRCTPRRHLDARRDARSRWRSRSAISRSSHAGSALSGSD